MTSKPAPRFLAEWQRQEAVLLAWPHETTDWSPWLNQISQTYVELTQAISETATPLILCRNQSHEDKIRTLLGNPLADKSIFHQCPYNDTWCRDYGPIALGDSKPQVLLSFQFTGWGNKYQANDDNQVNQHLNNAGAWAVELKEIPFDLEGGAIETDGQGTLLTTEACLMAGNRNTSMNKEAVEKTLITHLGVDRILWLTTGFLIGDDTDSHVDNLVRFANPTTLLYASCDNPNDPHYQPLKAMEAEVKALKTRAGEPYRCLALPIPDAIFDEHGTRLPASYVNFLILNDTVIMPVFDSDKDQTAMETMKTAFPKARLITIDGRQLIKQYGGPHCATMQLPQHSLQSSFLAGAQSC